MDHFYQDIFGWWGEPDRQLYRKMVNEFPSGSHFVEVGSFKGRSSACMAVEIINSGKQIKFDCIDTWEGSREHREGGWAKDEDVVSGRLFDVFLENTSKVSNIINPIRTPSTEAASLYETHSLDFVFIDGSHDFENVLNDIRSWIPKVKVGGVIAGHDYSHEGVKIAVDSFFENMPPKDERSGFDEITDCLQFWDSSDCWFVRKNFETPPVISHIPMRLDQERARLLYRLGIAPDVGLHASYKNLIAALPLIVWSFKT